jgi:hypothetical protein
LRAEGCLIRHFCVSVCRVKEQYQVSVSNFEDLPAIYTANKPAQNHVDLLVLDPYYDDKRSVLTYAYLLLARMSGPPMPTDELMSVLAVP